MSSRTPLSRSHPVHVVHRISAAIIGVGLLAFAFVGLLAGPSPVFSTGGRYVFGLSTNGALSWISVVAGAVLVVSAIWGGPVASAVSTAVGALFLLSGLVHLAVLHTPLNLLAFEVSNVLFSLAVGLLLLFSGLYGRVAGGLPADNPYRLSHPRRKRRPRPREQRDADSEPDAEERAMLEAEVAMGEGTATPEQERLIRRDQARRHDMERKRAYRKAREKGNGDSGPQES